MASIDTLELVRDLRASDFSEKQAEGLARVLRRVFDDDAAKPAADLAPLDSKSAPSLVDPPTNSSFQTVDLGDAHAEVKRELIRSKNEILLWSVPLILWQIGATIYLISRTY